MSIRIGDWHRGKRPGEGLMYIYIYTHKYYNIWLYIYIYMSCYLIDYKCVHI
jgi:hypothetical protein